MYLDVSDVYPKMYMYLGTSHRASGGARRWEGKDPLWEKRGGVLFSGEQKTTAFFIHSFHTHPNT
jgi:hypothetical protein